MSDYEFIKFSRAGGRADLAFNNPPHNLLSVEMLEEIIHALDTLRDDDSLKVLLIKGDSDTFCGGVRIEDIVADKIGALMPLYSRIYNYLNDIRGVTISAVMGEASGFGCEIAAFCDICIAAENAIFSFPQIRLGLFPPIATAILPRLIGRNRTIDWITSGRRVTATEAMEASMVARTIPDLALITYADAYAERLNSFSAPAVVLAKRAIDQALYTPAMEALRTTEALYMLDLMNSLDPTEGLNASLEDRDPVWKNK